VYWVGKNVPTSSAPRITLCQRPIAPPRRRRSPTRHRSGRPWHPWRGRRSGARNRRRSRGRTGGRGLGGRSRQARGSRTGSRRRCILSVSGQSLVIVALQLSGALGPAPLLLWASIVSSSHGALRTATATHWTP